jgi:DNA uptake protein ComE-like DNA-binding protein|tara:strand:+ start:342 stop:980 length:639 start_codon:yes stop_codon:yes gene_type:complete
MKNITRALTVAAALTVLLSASVAAQVGENLGLVNPNLATAEEIGAVDGFNNDAVHAIMEGRPFLKMSELHTAISAHIAEDAFAQVYAGLWLPIDLNDVTDEEILLIPNVGARMLHEFREYAPFEALSVFHREIDKYVDDDELARLEQYVYVRIDLNTASNEAILSLPGIGARMLHEFDEYRPYEAIAQFRREMGKYVDEDEVARMERYVEIR